MISAGFLHREPFYFLCRFRYRRTENKTACCILWNSLSKFVLSLGSEFSRHPEGLRSEFSRSEFSRHPYKRAIIQRGGSTIAKDGRIILGRGRSIFLQRGSFILHRGSFILRRGSVVKAFLIRGLCKSKLWSMQSIYGQDLALFVRRCQNQDSKIVVNMLKCSHVIVHLVG